MHAREPGSGLAGLMGSGTPTIDPVPTTGDWFIPAGFDQDTFLDEAKNNLLPYKQLGIPVTTTNCDIG